MEITEVRIKLVAGGNDKLRAFCSITIDNDFVIRDLKVIEGTKGPFVAMPSRKLMHRCPRCGGKNPSRAHFCNDCGGKLPQGRIDSDLSQRLKLHADIAHPINSRCREVMQAEVLEEYSREIERARRPEYEPPSLDFYEQECVGGRMPASFRRPGGEPACDGLRERAAEEFVDGQGESTFESASRVPRGGAPRGRGRGEPRGRGAGQPGGGREGRGVPFPAGSRGRLEGVDAGEERRVSELGDLYGARNRGDASSDGLGKRETGDLFDGDSFRQKKHIREEVETEPEDNFGAGIFS